MCLSKDIEVRIKALEDRLAALRREIGLMKRSSHRANQRRQLKLDRVDLLAMELSDDIAVLIDELKSGNGDND